MTVQTNTTIATGIGNGVTSVFPITFKFNRAEDLIVYLVDEETEAETPLTLYSDYTIDGAGTENGGTLTLLAGPLPIGQNVVAQRIVDLRQLTDLRNQGRFFAEVHEDVFDKLVMIDQQQQTQLDRSMVVDLLWRWNALNRRIINVGDPVADKDATHKRYVDQGDSDSRQYADERDAHWVARSLRTPDPVSLLPGPESRGGRLLSFDRSGKPIALAASSGSARELALLMADPKYGPSLLSRGVVAVDSITDLLNLPAAMRREDLRYLVASYHGGWAVQSEFKEPTGGGEFLWEAESTDADDGGTIFQPADGAPGRFRRVLNGTCLDAAWFGADPLGFEPSSDAIQKCNDVAEKIGGWWQAQGKFNCEKGLVITTACRTQEAEFHFYSVLASQAVLLRAGPNAEIPDILQAKELRIGKVINKSFSSLDSWMGYPFGVVGESLIECEVYLSDIYGFNVGYRATTGVRNPHAYNKVFVQKFTNCKVGLQLQPGSANGYVNENQFYGGRFQMDSGLGTNIAGTRQVQILPFDEGAWSTGWPNNNTFYSPSLEGNGPEYHIEVMGAYNVFFKPRLEANPAKVLVRGAIGAPQTMAGWNSIYEPYGVPNTIKFTHQGVIGGNGVAIQSSRGVWQNAGISLYSSDAQTGHIVGYMDGLKNPNDQSSENFRYWLSPIALRGRNAGDTFDRLKLEFQTGRLRFGSGSSEPTGYLSSYGDGTLRFFNYNVVAGPDNTHSLGAASTRWSEVFAGSGTINTSDGREKQQVRELSEAERAVAVRLKSLVRIFKFNDAVDKKGKENARSHSGWVAQEVKAAFEAEGLVAEDYALLCYDQWEEQLEQCDGDGTVLRERVEAGDRYGIRYEELLAFIIAVL